jgi:hypothetical protein
MKFAMGVMPLEANQHSYFLMSETRQYERDRSLNLRGAMVTPSPMSLYACLSPDDIIARDDVKWLWNGRYAFETVSSTRLFQHNGCSVMTWNGIDTITYVPHARDVAIALYIWLNV